MLNATLDIDLIRYTSTMSHSFDPLAFHVQAH